MKKISNILLGMFMLTMGAFGQTIIEPNQVNFSNGFTLNASTNVFTDDGTNFLRNGVLVAGGGANPLTNNSIFSTMIAPDQVNTEDIATGAVGADELADNSVDIGAIQGGVLSLDVTNSGTGLRVKSTYGIKFPSAPGAGDDGKVLTYNNSGGAYNLTTASIGDMTAAEYSITGGVGVVDQSLYSSLAGDTLKLNGKTLFTGDRTNDEIVVTYDSGNDRYEHRSLAGLGGGDMLKSTYDADTDNIVDSSETSAFATNATYSQFTTGIIDKVVSTNGRADETVVTYDADTDKYLHRSLGGLGGGDMLKSTYDVDTDNVVDLAETATVANAVANNTITSAKIVDGTIVDGDINASAAITPSKISGTALTQSTSFGGDVDGTYNSITVVGLRDYLVTITNPAPDQVLAVTTDNPPVILNRSLGELGLYDQSLNTTDSPQFAGITTTNLADQNNEVVNWQVLTSQVAGAQGTVVTNYAFTTVATGSNGAVLWLSNSTDNAQAYFSVNTNDVDTDTDTIVTNYVFNKVSTGSNGAVLWLSNSTDNAQAYFSVNTNDVNTTYTAGIGLALNGTQFYATNILAKSLSITNTHTADYTIKSSNGTNFYWDAAGGVNFTGAPASNTAPGVVGTLVYSNNYLYVCISTNEWLRAQLFTW